MGLLILREEDRMAITTCVFDAYGTLFDVAAAARRLAERPGHEDFAAKWPRLAELWRLKQLQYSWLRASTGVHTDFWQVTQDGLDHAIEAVGGVREGERQALLEHADYYSYREQMLGFLEEYEGGARPNEKQADAPETEAAPSGKREAA